MRNNQALRAKDIGRRPSVDNLHKGGTRRILVVDDEKVIRDVLVDALSLFGCKVDVASNGIEGLDLFLRSSFDLVLTDWHMPGMDGLTMAFNIKRRSANTPIVLITGGAKEGIMEKLKGSGVDFVLFKPFGLDQIRETVQMISDHGALERKALECQ